jgi:hypothetical protein
MMPGSILAMHQPNYLPWPGYLHKMAACDVFVYLDSVQFPRGQSFAARNRIKGPNGAEWLTVPVRKPTAVDGKAPYLDVEFAEDGWRDKHLARIRDRYRRAPAFDEVFPLYEAALGQGERFVDVTIPLLETFAGYLGIETRRVRLSDLEGGFGQRSDLIVGLCGALGADVYLSGGGARSYNDEQLMRQHGIALRYDEYQYPSHPQLWGEFVPNLSVVDVLFNCGQDARELVVDG